MLYGVVFEAGQTGIEEVNLPPKGKVEVNRLRT